MTEPIAVVYGAGKIARGFVGCLLGMSGYATTFVDVDRHVVELIAQRGRYTVHILGAPEKDTVVTDVTAITSDDPRSASVLDDAAIAFVSVGGKNLPSVARTIAPALHHRFEATQAPLNLIVCENWQAAGKTLREAIAAELDPADRETFARLVGVAESTIMRSGIAPTAEQSAADPLAVQAQDYWQLPVDGDALVGDLPAVEGIQPVAGFSTALERKLFTYNCGNATISFLGWLRGHQYLSEAANDPALQDIITEVYRETSETMVRRHGYDPEEQRAYAQQSLDKFKDASIIDPLTRQLADPIRKLGPNDRLVGAGLAALEAGVEPDAIAIGIAAALRHRNPDDPSAVRLAELIAAKGEAGALAEITGLPEDHELIRLAIAKLPLVDSLTTTPVA